MVPCNIVNNFKCKINALRFVTKVFFQCNRIENFSEILCIKFNQNQLLIYFTTVETVTSYKITANHCCVIAYITTAHVSRAVQIEIYFLSVCSSTRLIPEVAINYGVVQNRQTEVR